MKLARVQKGTQPPLVGVLEGDQLLLTAATEPLAILEASERPLTGERISWSALLAGNEPHYRLLAPIDPPEVWACGFTFKRGSQFSSSPMLPSGPAYTAAIAAGRPEIFFKTTGFRVVGPNGKIGIRGDASYTAVEAELCIILDANARPVLFTAGNDVSAWDIEARNPLWLAQCKTYEACCALGPLAVTADELPPDATIQCRVRRGSAELFSGSVSIRDMHWTFQEIAHFAAAFNPLPAGTVIMTGTAIIRPDSEGLAAGDVVEVEIEGIGTLRNVGKLLTSAVPFVPYE